MPGVIAVAGVSADESKYGFLIFRDLLAAGREVYGVNPKGGRILDREIFPSVSALPVKPDVVIIVVQPDITAKIVDDCIAAGVREIWMQPGSENDTAIEKAKKSGIEVIARACFMVRGGFW